MAEPASALVAVCVNDTPDNQRWRTTVRCLTSLGITTDLCRHDLVLIDNGSTCANSRAFMEEWCQDLIGIRDQRVTLVRFPANQFATHAFNHVLQTFLPRVPGRMFVRVENDLEMVSPGWVDILGAIFAARREVGAIATKPYDLPTKGLDGVPIRIADRDCLAVDEIPGYCTAFRPGVFEQLGCLVSAGRYIEDGLTSVRLRKLGWELLFTDSHSIECYHVDRRPTTAYRDWKQTTARDEWDAYVRLRREFESGRRDPRQPFEQRQVPVDYPYLSATFA